MSNKERQELIEYLEKIGEVPEWVREAVLYDFKPTEHYTRDKVIYIIENLLEYPDQLIDAVSNENTNWYAESLLEMVEEGIEAHRIMIEGK